MYFVYLVECSDNSLYTGITNDLERRFNQHKDKKGGAYTRAHRVERIKYIEEFKTRGEALKREAQIKSWRRDKKLALMKK